MKICIDGNNILRGMRATRRYAVNLLRGLMKIDTKNIYIIFYVRFRKPPYPKLDISGHNNFVNKTIYFPGSFVKKLWESWDLPKIETLVGNIDIFHAVYNNLPPRKKAKYLFTIHFPFPLSEKWANPEHVAQRKELLEKAVNIADYFICVSETQRQAFLELYPRLSDRTKTIPLGIGEEFKPLRPADIKEALNKKSRMNRPYVLYVGGIEPRKNVQGIVEAYNLLCQKRDFTHLLVFAGDRLGESDALTKRIKELNLQDRIIFTGYLEQETDDLPLLYNGADLFVFPSFSEGWTSPPLEAMACGTPVITSNVSSLPETVGDAAVMVNPSNYEEIAEAMCRVLSESDLRRNLIEKGFKQARMFTWQKTAQETLTLYEKLCYG